MARPVYRMEEGSLQQRFQNSKAKIQVYGGGFANGKTAGMCVKILRIAKDYPGANILAARSTYPKLNDTFRKEFFKWCPAEWIKRKPTKDDNTLILTNGTTINFRYIAQQGKSNEASTSNLLSATYDLIAVDQMEDPEITEKDFDDLLGRLRGSARYIGDDRDMPDSGPRWFLISLNPTRNWCYRKLIRPYHEWQASIAKKRERVPAELLQDKHGKPILEVYEGSTYENRLNVPLDFIETLETTYRGTMRERFLLGKWGAYEGLVYPDFDESIHLLDEAQIQHYLTHLYQTRVEPEWIEAYDHGLAVPGCYLAGFVDMFGNVIVMDGAYEKEKSVDWWSDTIKAIRSKWGIDSANPIYADPALFRRSTGDKKTVGRATSDLFWENRIRMVRGNNDVLNGIHKVGAYLHLYKHHAHPLYEEAGSPYIFFSRELKFLVSEISDYYWAKNSRGEYEDKPMDRNDHAMDALKYMLTDRPDMGRVLEFNKRKPVVNESWVEMSSPSRNPKAHRYG